MAEYHVSPDGSDGNDGSAGSPWFSLNHAGSNVSAGDTVVVADGTYDYSGVQRLGADGASDSPITVRAAQGATPTISFGGSSSGGWSSWDDGGIRIEGAHWTVEGLEVADSPYQGILVKGGGTGATIRDCAAHGNHLVGVRIDSASDVLIENCEAYDNYGSTSNGGDSDGIQLISSDNSAVRNCDVWNNGDDGLDLWETHGVVVADCTAYDNGRDGGDGNGFKMGGQDSGATSGDNEVVRSAAWGNANIGFNYNDATDPVRFYNNTSWNNSQGFWAENCELVNNISHEDGRTASLSNNVTNESNTWTLGIDDPQFRSTDPEADDFLRPAEDSPVVDAGSSLDLTYDGDAPDLGAYEATASNDSPWREVPVYHHAGGASGWQEATVYRHTGDGFEQAPLKTRR